MNLVTCSWTVQLSSGQLVSCSKDKTIRFWDLPTGKTVKVLRGHSDYVRTLLLLADGRIVSGSDDHTMRVWRLGVITFRITLRYSNLVQSIALTAVQECLSLHLHHLRGRLR